MTCKEKIMAETPGLASPGGMIYGCPQDHGYLPSPDYCEWPIRHGRKCLECWDREIPENNNELEKEKENMKETEWTRTEVEAMPNVRERSSAEIAEEMDRIHNECRAKLDRLEREYAIARKREKLEAAACELKVLVDSYISAGFTRDEAMSIVLTNIAALSPN